MLVRTLSKNVRLGLSDGSSRADWTDLREMCIGFNSNITDNDRMIEKKRNDVMVRENMFVEKPFGARPKKTKQNKYALI